MGNQGSTPDPILPTTDPHVKEPDMQDALRMHKAMMVMRHDAIKLLRYGCVASSANGAVVYVIPNTQMMENRDGVLVDIKGCNIHVQKGSFLHQLYTEYSMRRHDMGKKVLRQIFDGVYDAMERQCDMVKTVSLIKFMERHALNIEGIESTSEIGPLWSGWGPDNIATDPDVILNIMKDKVPVPIDVLIDAMMLEDDMSRSMTLAGFIDAYMRSEDTSVPIDQFFETFMKTRSRYPVGDMKSSVITDNLAQETRKFQGPKDTDMGGREIMQLTRTSVMKKLRVIGRDGDKYYKDKWDEVVEKAFVMDMILEEMKGVIGEEADGDMQLTISEDMVSRIAKLIKK